jgi:ribosome-binding factor A
MKQTPASRKVNETARAVLAQLLLTELADPRLTLLTLTSVEVSRDRSVADAYVVSDPSRYAETSQGLESAKGRLRFLLGRELGWRVTPELRFHIDTGLDYAMSINEALKNVPETHATKDAENLEEHGCEEDAPCGEGSQS